MKKWIVPLAAGAFVIGLGAGVSARRTSIRTETATVPARGERGSSGTGSSGTWTGAIRIPQASSPGDSSRIPWLAPAEGQELPPRMLMLRRLAERLPRDRVASALPSVVYYDKQLQWKAYELSKETSDDETLDLLVKLLSGIDDEDLRGEVLADLACSTDPIRRRFLAGVIGSYGQGEAFTAAAIDLLSDKDLEVVRATLGGMYLSRFRDSDEREQVAGLLKAAAAWDKPAPLRARALACLWGAREANEVSFLVDALTRERDPECLVSAMSALSDSRAWRDRHSHLLVEAVRMMSSIAQDPARPMKVRRRAAKYALNADYTEREGEVRVLSAPERSLLYELYKDE